MMRGWQGMEKKNKNSDDGGMLKKGQGYQVVLRRCWGCLSNVKKTSRDHFSGNR
jgi:hypothetical protein